MSQLTMPPTVTVSAGGAALPPAEMRALEAVRVEQRLALPAQCELIFSDPPGPLTTAEGLSPGTRLRVDVQSAGPALFHGEVTAVEHVYGPAGQRQIVVRAYDLLHRLRKRQPVRAHVQTTAAELVRELVADLGLRVEEAAAGPMRRWLIQHRRTDWQLLSDLATEVGLYPVLREQTLHLVTLAGIDEPEVDLELGRTLLEARVEVNSEPACRSVRWAGWDPVRVESHQAQASAGRIGRQVAAAAPPGQVGSTGERHSMGQLVYGDGHAQAAAQAELDRRLAYEVALWGMAEGDSRLRPGTPVRVSGLAGPLAGRYVLTAVTHTVDGQRGFLSELSTLPPMPGQPLPWTSTGEDAVGGVAVLGFVTAVNDPQGAGRVRTTFPALGGVESDWMHVVCPGAGAGKGLIALPDVDDRVLVLLPQGEAGAGVVLGGLYGMGGPPDGGIEGSRVRRSTFVTSGGQRIVLDDAKKLIHLEDATGNVVELSPDRLWIHAEHDLELEAPGHSVVVRGSHIDFQRG